MHSHGAAADACGARIRQEIEARTGRAVSAGAVYTGLDRLEARGLETSWEGDATPARGGRRKKFYRLEPKGAASLHDTWTNVAEMADGMLPDLRHLADSWRGTPDSSQMAGRPGPHLRPLRRLLPESVLGDLMEEHAVRRSAQGAVRASLWFWGPRSRSSLRASGSTAWWPTRSPNAGGTSACAWRSAPIRCSLCARSDGEVTPAPRAPFGGEKPTGVVG